MTTRSALALLALLALAAPATAGCLEDGGLLRSSLNCWGHPTVPKFFDPTTFRWGDREILAATDGNELLYWDATNPAAPAPIAGSNWNVPNQGDSDYDLLAYSVCDDCRYGVGAWKLGIVIWDHGTGATPRFASRHFYPIGTDPRGALTYRVGSTQYVIAKDLPGDAGGIATLYRLTGVEGLEPLGRVPVPDGFEPVGGFHVGGYLYLGTLDNWVHILRIEGEGLAYVGRSPIRAYLGRGKGLGVAGAVAVSAWLDGARLWDISDPAAPVELALIPGDHRYAAIGGDFAWVVGPDNVPATYDIRRPSRPVLMDPDFWDPDNPWNRFGTTCEFVTGAAFSGASLYLGRYVVLQRIDFTACPPPDVIFADGFDSGNATAWD